MTKTLILGLIIASWAAPLGQAKPKHAAREYVVTFVSVPDRSPNYKGFNRVIGVNAKGDALIHSCQVYSDGAPCRLYLWSEKDGLQPVGLQPCSMGSCQMSLTGTEVLLNDRGEVGGHVATSVLVWSKHNGVQTLGSVNVFSASHPPTAAFNNRAEVA